MRLLRTWLYRLTHDHIHHFDWVMEPEGSAWVVFDRCRICAFVQWTATARDRADLNATLTDAFRKGRLSALGYYTAPTNVPDTADAAEAWA